MSTAKQSDASLDRRWEFASCRSKLSGLWLLVLTGACSGGYPPPDAVPIETAKLNPAQRLEAMNQLGKTALPGHRWRYDFSPEYVLEVQTRKPGGERHVFRTSLCSVDVDIRHEPQKDIYEVRSTPKSMSSHTEHVLMQSATHFDAAFMRGLLRSMQSVCSNSMPHRLML